MVGDFGFDDAIDLYLELHPEAEEAELRARLVADLAHAEKTGEYR